MIHQLLVFGIGLFLATNLLAQSPVDIEINGEKIPVTMSLETPVSFGDDLPFWMHSNRFGIIDKSGSNLLGGITLHRRGNDKEGINFDFGVDLYARLANQTQVFANEFYGAFRYKSVSLFFGKEARTDGLIESELDLGSMIWSGNAATMQRIGLRTESFVSVPFTNEIVALKGYWFHGWFNGNRFVDDVLLHEKAGYIRLLNDEHPFRFYAGLIHNVQWGGRSPVVGSLPKSLNDFRRIVLGDSGAEDAIATERENALGNTVAAYEGGFDFDVSGWKIWLIRQFYIETNVGARFRNGWDGIWTAQLIRNNGATFLGIEELVYNHVNTKRQSSRSSEEIGNDGYYSNSVYRSGWTNSGRILGLSLVDLGQRGGNLEPVNVIMLAHHLGLKGRIGKDSSNFPFRYQVQVSYRRSYGRTTNCFSGEAGNNDIICLSEGNPLRTPRRDQWFTRLVLGANLTESLRLDYEFGYDFGELFTNTGMGVRIAYTF